MQFVDVFLFKRIVKHNVLHSTYAPGPLKKKLPPGEHDIKPLFTELFSLFGQSVEFGIGCRIGKFFNKVFERKYLMKIPGYRIARETVMQFFGKNKSFFSQVVLVRLFNSDTLMTGFITEDQGDIITVFVPTGPNPTSGNIYHVSREQVLFTEAQVDNGMKTIISCGAGSSEIFNKAEGEVRQLHTKT